jgi:AraC family transcriptional regulator of adaptative response / DNA-3-methyladenine glycosylase II
VNLNWQVCSRARLSRDARFDGKFFIGVVGTGVYCRPVCPSPAAHEKNCRYFQTPAEAAKAGFRPCLRCRPGSQPGTPAWSGTATTVLRALRLIAETRLEEGGVEALAERLGVSTRHLRRLFLRHLGSTPVAVAQSCRLSFAKKLVDETTLPMGHIALDAGFGCVRRFNASMNKAYHRTPTQIRRLARQKKIQPGNQYAFRLSFRPPYHWQGILDFLAASCTPGVEIVEADCYRRTICVDGKSGHFEVCPDLNRHSLVVRVEFADARALFLIVERIRAIFDLNADWASIAETLNTDPALAPWVESYPGLRVPGSWDRFELLIRAILGQNNSLKGASALAGRLAATFGKPFRRPNGLRHVFPKPETLADANLGAIDLNPTCADTIKRLARAVCDGKINFEGVVDSEAFLRQLGEIPGISESTAQYVAMRAPGQPDAFPSTDLGLQCALKLRNQHDIERRAEGWRPWRAYAAMYLWRFGAQERVNRENRALSFVRRNSQVDTQRVVAQSSGAL